MRKQGLDQALHLIAARGATAQLRVLRDRQVVLDRAIGGRPDDPYRAPARLLPFQHRADGCRLAVRAERRRSACSRDSPNGPGGW